MMMWSDLPSDLLLPISETLTLPDFVSFSSVCRSWRCFASTVKHHRRCRHQDPWLMFVGGEDPSAANFYSISDQKIFTIPNQPDPPIANRLCIGSAHGWLITADERSELSLLNPVTHQQIDLPSISTFDHIFPSRRDPSGRITHYYLKCYNNGSLIKYTVESLRFGLYIKATLSSSPSVGGGDYTVVLLLCQPNRLPCQPDLLACQPNRLAFARSGDSEWKMIGPDRLWISDIAYHDDGKVYTVLTTGEVQSWDFSSENCGLPKPTLFVPEPELEVVTIPYFFYLVPAPWGDLLHVLRERDGESLDAYTMTSSIKVHRVDFGTGTVVKVKSLGDYALFIGGNLSVCISSKDVPGLKGNCVYFTDDSLETNQGYRDSRRDIGIFNLEDGSIEAILPDDSRLNWPPPIWLTPSVA